MDLRKHLASRKKTTTIRNHNYSKTASRIHENACGRVLFFTSRCRPGCVPFANRIRSGYIKMNFVKNNRPIPIILRAIDGASAYPY